MFQVFIQKINSFYYINRLFSSLTSNIKNSHEFRLNITINIIVLPSLTYHFNIIIINIE